MLVSFENSKSDAFLKHSEKNDKRKENREKSYKRKENRHFCTYPTSLFEARIEGYWRGHISARSPYFFFGRDHINVWENLLYFLENRLFVRFFRSYNSRKVAENRVKMGELLLLLQI